MAALAADKSRAYTIEAVIDVPFEASTTWYQGSAIGDNGSGYGQALVAGDPFLGFAAFNGGTGGSAAGAVRARIVEQGYLHNVTVTNGTSQALANDTVYMSTDNDFTVASTSNTAIGKLVERNSDGTWTIFFQSIRRRSL